MPNITYNTGQGPMRVLTVCSGPGKATWSALDLQKELAAAGDSPFEVTGLYADRPVSPALEEADRRSLPKYLLDSSEYHHGQPGEQMSPEDILAYEKAMIELTAPARPDCLLIDGYQWTIGRYLLDRFLAVRIWPAGPACLKRFIQSGEKVLRAKTTFLTAPGGLGPAIVTAPPVTIDYSRFTDEKSGISLYLTRVMEQSGRAGARAIQEIARGNFSFDDQGSLLYQGRPAPDGLVLDSWN